MVATGCANRGIGPQGGPVDTIPPSVVKETPENGTLNYNSKRVEIIFNEYLQLDDVSKHVLISPPQQRPPEVKAIGKKVILVFEEPTTGRSVTDILETLRKPTPISLVSTPH